MTMRKKSDGHFSEKKESKSVPAHPSDATKGARNKGSHTKLGGQQPEGPSRPLNRCRGAVPRPPGSPHPSGRSARGNPSPSARQRGRQPTNPVASADLHRQRRSPARRALRPPPPFSSPNKHPSPEVTSLPPPPATPPHSVSAAL